MREASLGQRGPAIQELPCCCDQSNHPNLSNVDMGTSQGSLDRDRLYPAWSSSEVWLRRASTWMAASASRVVDCPLSSVMCSWIIQLECDTLYADVVIA